MSYIREIRKPKASVARGLIPLLSTPIFTPNTKYNTKWHIQFLFTEPITTSLLSQQMIQFNFLWPHCCQSTSIQIQVLKGHSVSLKHSGVVRWLINFVYKYFVILGSKFRKKRLISSFWAIHCMSFYHIQDCATQKSIIGQSNTHNHVQLTIAKSDQLVLKIKPCSYNWCHKRMLQPLNAPLKPHSYVIRLCD